MKNLLVQYLALVLAAVSGTRKIPLASFFTGTGIFISTGNRTLQAYIIGKKEVGSGGVFFDFYFLRSKCRVNSFTFKHSLKLALYLIINLKRLKRN